MVLQLRLFEMLRRGLVTGGGVGSGSVDRSASTLGQRLNRNTTVDLAVFFSLRRTGPGAGALLLLRRLLIPHLGWCVALVAMEMSGAVRHCLQVSGEES